MNNPSSTLEQDLASGGKKIDSVDTLRQSNRKTGVYYTPRHIADDIASRTLSAVLKDLTGVSSQRLRTSNLDPDKRTSAIQALRTLRVLDPAVGEGVFLLAAAEWLAWTRRELGDKLSERSMKQKILRDCLYGVDIDKRALETCRNVLAEWAGVGNDDSVLTNLRHGNSLVGWFEVPSSLVDARRETLDDLLWNSFSSKRRNRTGQTPVPMKPFHWGVEFPEVMATGFDVVLGNPPYGNILSHTERHLISRTRRYDVSTGRTGTWNSAALFIARTRSLLREGGYLGFLIPNSVLRTRQFKRARQFLLREMMMWLVIDEANPFADVTLEMVSIFCRAQKDDGNHEIKVISRRPEIDWEGQVPWMVLDSSGVFPLYYDSTLAGIMKKATKGWITASRGRDIPKAHVRPQRSKRFSIPYATSGRSVKRYRLDSRYLIYSDMTFKKDPGLLDSYDNEFLVSTKNYPYPRCVMKPKGVIHGGGAVRIIPLREGVDLESLGLVLNSRLVRYLCLRYLTNYSQLTTCLNTGIMEELPLLFPDNPMPFSVLFRALEALHDSRYSDCRHSLHFLEKLSDALVYELFLLDSDLLACAVEERLSDTGDELNPQELSEMLQDETVTYLSDKVLSSRIVREVESSYRMN
ncbi:MAG: class I SAM-dependent DNA methyltransferase [Promethearchaeota archaeon]